MLVTPSPEAARRLRSLLVDAGFTETGVHRRVGATSPPLSQNRNLARFLEVTREPDPLNALIRLLYMGVPVAAEMRGLLDPELLALLLESGLIGESDVDLEPKALLVPVGESYVASDHTPRLHEGEHEDHVLSTGPSARALLTATIRDRVASVLDVGAGCGVQAFAAAAHAERVVATDLNPRAVAYTAFGARLNGFDHVEARTGSLLEPVEGERFDLIVSNPPFIISPSTRLVFRENPMELDGFCRTLAREASRHLNPGGHFQMVCEWAEVDGEPWEERLAGWFRDTGCDAWVLEHTAMHPTWYALTRIRELAQVSEAADADAYGEWMDYYRSHRVRTIHGGLVVLRRRDGENWLKIEDMPDGTEQPFGDAIRDGFRARDLLEAHPGDALGDTRLRAVKGMELEVVNRVGDDGAWDTASLRFRLPEGLRYAIQVDGPAAELVTQFDGRHTTGELLTALAERVEADPAEVRREGLTMIANLVERGFLVPAGS